MTPLAGAVLQILIAESSFPPLSVESLVKVLFAVGFGEGRLEESVIEDALSELLAAGAAERVHSARMGPRYRAMPIPALVSK